MEQEHDGGLGGYHGPWDRPRNHQLGRGRCLVCFVTRMGTELFSWIDFRGVQERVQARNRGYVNDDHVIGARGSRGPQELVPRDIRNGS